MIKVVASCLLLVAAFFTHHENMNGAYLKSGTPSVKIMMICLIITMISLVNVFQVLSEN